jgi:hypothetical protein
MAEHVTATIAAAPSNFLIMLLSISVQTDPASLPESAKRFNFERNIKLLSLS